jgi:DNA polymerase alpha subunit A
LKAQTVRTLPSASVSFALDSSSKLTVFTGLDPARYRTQNSDAIIDREFFTFESQISDKERFKEADPLMLRCPACEATFNFEGLLEDTVSWLH